MASSEGAPDRDNSSAWYVTVCEVYREAGQLLASKEGAGMRRVILMLAMMAVTLVVAGEAVLAVNKVGTDEPDTLRGTDKSDNLLGKGGDDRVFGRGGSDHLLGGTGNDLVFGGDELGPSGGDRNLVGGPGNDVVGGGQGSDNMIGAEGNDLLIESSSWRETDRDRISGGGGDDVFDVFNKPAAKDVVVCAGGMDRVMSDGKDVVAPNCEKVFVGLGSFEEFVVSIPQDFFEGLPPPFNQQ